ncbi:MAG: prepilin-type N-terminal cleavage/methylation domain-containing protein [Candidatus Sericytochromatia bacterium]
MPSRKTLNSGFTIFEILTVVIIITILALIAIPNFIHSKDNAQEASMETNARTLRIMLETYKVDYSEYPEDLRTLGREATAKKYNKEAANPFTGVGGPVESGKWAMDYVGTTGPPGMVAYQPVSGNTKYYIFAYERNGNLLKRNGQVFTMSNG